MTNKKAIEQSHFIIKEDSELTYIVGAMGGSSPIDIRLILLENQTFTDEEGNVINRNVSNHQIIMTPQVAENIKNILDQQLNEVFKKK
ncbi:hypothetical protein LJB96_04110 [Methanobrevibacter sp. OttesenSCG-928-K11]|nr:hypothetical protein [Methanobrevibacter sp. OttesenSCG-928-K11]